MQWHKLHEETPANNIDGLVQNVVRSWDEYDPKLLNRLFLTHQSTCDSIIKNYGDNNFDAEHLAKEALERQGTLPEILPVSQESKNVILEHLFHHDSI
jgi:hypothetical protein